MSSIAKLTISHSPFNLKCLLALLLWVPLVGNKAISQSPTPGAWQNTIVSSESDFPDIECDTVISRTYGASLLLSCARVPNFWGEAMYHRFVVRCMNSNKYFEFDILPIVRDTQLLYTDRISYYIHDMRMSDSICFFCGTKVVRRNYDPNMGFPNPPAVLWDTMTSGFFGRMNIKTMLRDSNAYYVPVSLDPNPPTTPVPVTEWHPNVQISEIPQTSSLDKLWVDNGLHIDGFKWAKLVGSSTATPYTDNKEYYENSFSLESAHAYIIGRLDNSNNSSCLVEIHSGLNYYSGPTFYTIREPEMPEEVLTDVTGNDVRVLFSSRVYKDIDETFRKSHMIGIRYKDIHDIDDDYLDNLHLYSHYNKQTDYPMRDDEFGHLCRVKNYHDSLYSSGQFVEDHYTDKDFCVVYSCTNMNNQYLFGYSKTLVLHINADMTQNTAFELGHANSAFDAGGFPVSNVSYLSNSNMNRMAISYRSPFNQDYIELIDWGYYEIDFWGYPVHAENLDIPFATSARLYTGSMVKSMDVFLGGNTLLMGGTGINSTGMKLLTQLRSSISNGSANDVCCDSTKNIINANTFSYSTLETNSKLLLVHQDELQWNPHPTTAHKKSLITPCIIEQ